MLRTALFTLGSTPLFAVAFGACQSSSKGDVATNTADGGTDSGSLESDATNGADGSTPLDAASESRPDGGPQAA
jgi:hypothetical protein